MFESGLLESGKVVRGSRISGIGAKVVDDAENFTILVHVPPEGKAVIETLFKPPEFIPNKAFAMSVRARNDGESDLMFARFTNTDTGEILKESVIYVLAGNGWDCPCMVTLTQTTDFHGRLEVGHVEE